MAKKGSSTDLGKAEEEGYCYHHHFRKLLSDRVALLLCHVHSFARCPQKRSYTIGGDGGGRGEMETMSPAPPAPTPSPPRLLRTKFEVAKGGRMTCAERKVQRILLLLLPPLFLPNVTFLKKAFLASFLLPPLPPSPSLLPLPPRPQASTNFTLLGLWLHPQTDSGNISRIDGVGGKGECLDTTVVQYVSSVKR